MVLYLTSKYCCIKLVPVACVVEHRLKITKRVKKQKNDFILSPSVERLIGENSLNAKPEEIVIDLKEFYQFNILVFYNFPDRLSCLLNQRY